VNGGGGDARDFHVFPISGGAHPCLTFAKPQWPENPAPALSLYIRRPFMLRLHSMPNYAIAACARAGLRFKYGPRNPAWHGRAGIFDDVMNE
jgi:hypothetical protein